MTQELFDANLERISRYNLKLPKQLIDGYILLVGDKVFVNDYGCFVFSSAQDATKSFRQCCRHNVQRPYNDSGYNIPVTTKEWREFKRMANVRIAKYERQTD